MWIGGGPVSVFSGAVLKFLSLLKIVDQFQDGVTFEKQSNVVEATEALIDIYNETRIQASLENSKTSNEICKIYKT